MNILPYYSCIYVFNSYICIVIINTNDMTRGRELARQQIEKIIENQYDEFYVVYEPRASEHQLEVSSNDGDILQLDLYASLGDSGDVDVQKIFFYMDAQDKDYEFNNDDELIMKLNNTIRVVC